MKTKKMKTKKICIIGVFLLLVSFVNAQVSGTYKTTFGTLKLVCEKQNKIIYGDYGDKGTLLANLKTDYWGRIIWVGKFTNNNKQGSFEWRFEGEKMYGKWGWGDKLDGGKWNGSLMNKTLPSTIQKAVWSGEWNTTFGTLKLKQIGNKVTGKYRDLGNIKGTWNGTKLKGTFTNKGDKGSFEFVFNCNKFTGKWGWGNKLNKGAWSGTKKLKTNDCEARLTATKDTKDVPKELRYRLTLDRIYVISVDDGTEGVFAGYELFGIAWCRAYDENGKQIKPFDVTYSDRYGRFWEILPQNYVKADELNSYKIGKQITFDFPVKNPNEIDRLLKKSKIELTVELKDYDTTTSSDILGKERVTVPLNEAIKKKYSKLALPSDDYGKGVIHIKHGKGHLMVTYYIEKVE